MKKTTIFILSVLILFSIAIRMVSIIRPDGMAEKEDYNLSPANPIPIQIEDDDGKVTMDVILKYYSLKKYPPYRVGGPMIYFCRAIFFFASKLGVLKIYKDPQLYAFYPEEANKLFIFARLIVTLVFIPGIILALYFICLRFFSKTTALLSVFLIAINHYFLAWSWLLKSEFCTMFFSLLALYNLLRIIEEDKIKHYVGCGIFLGISAATKLSALPLVVIAFIISILLKIKNGKIIAPIFNRQNKIMFAAFIASFFISDPSYLLEFRQFVKLFLFGRVLQGEGSNPILSKFHEIVPGFIFLVKEFYALAGPVYFYLSPLILVYILWIFIHLRSSGKAGLYRLTVILFPIVYFLYLILTWTNAYKYVYYFMFPCLPFVIIIIADMISTFFHRSWQGGVAGKGMGILLLTLAAFTASLNIKWTYDYYSFWTHQDSRQLARDWITDNLPKGTSIGVPFEGHGLFSPYFKLDPFKYNLIRAGSNFQDIDNKLPQYLFWPRTDFNFSPMPKNDKYEIFKQFNAAKDILKNTKIAFMHRVQPYDIAELKSQFVPKENYTLEYRVGNLTRNDPEKHFRILSWQAITFLPVTSEIVEKKEGTLIDVTNNYFSRMVLPANPEGFRSGYFLHNMPVFFFPVCNIKYLITKDDQIVRNEFLKNPSVEMSLVENWEIEGKKYLLLQNKEYLPPVFFVGNAEVTTERVNKDYKLQNLLEGTLKDGKENFTIKGDFSIRISRETLSKYFGKYLLLSFYIKTRSPQVAVTIRNNFESKTIEYNVGGITKVMFPVKLIKKTDFMEIVIQTKDRAKIHGFKLTDLDLFSKNAQVEILEFGSRKIEAGVRTGQKGLIVFSMPNHGNWSALVNGRKTKILGAFNDALPAVFVDKGESLVKLIYN